MLAYCCLGVGNLVAKDIEEALILKAFFVSVFIGKV